MGRFEYAAAVEVFAKLAADEHADNDIRIDLAIAILNRQQPGDAEQALSILEHVLQAEPRNLRARFCAGLLMIYARRLDEAIEHLAVVTAADPRDAYAACWLGQCLLAKGDILAAEKEYRRAVEVDPYLQSGYYGLAQVLQRQEKRDDAQTMLEAFARLKDNPQARLADIKYMRMGPKAEVRPRDSTAAGANPVTAMPGRPAGPIFEPPTALPLVSPLPQTMQWAGAEATDSEVAKSTAPGAANLVLPSITACDINRDGKLDLFVASAIVRDGKTRNAMLFAEGDKFRLDLDHPLAGTADVRAALWGDYDNDGLVDVYLCRRGPNQLWRQTAGGKWSDVTATTLTDGGQKDTVDGLMFDADHDGDLDLFLVNADGPNELFSNNLDGTFRPLGAAQGIAGDGRPSRQALAVDIDNDRDLDMIVLHDQPPHDVYVNDRLWNYRAADGWQDFCKTPMQAALAMDSDVDGNVEIITRDDAAFTVWHTSDQGVQRGRRLTLIEENVAAGQNPSGERSRQPMAVTDATGEGIFALCTRHPHGGHPHGVGLLATLRETERSLETLSGLAECWSLCVFEIAAGPAIVDLPPGQPPRIWHPGPGRFPFAGLELSGRDKKSDKMRSNASGIGARLAVRIGRHWIAADTLRASTAPGQSLQPLAIGTRGAQQIDFVNIIWSDGVFQTEMELPARHRHRIEETQRQLSSCPVLFAWNGTEYAFVTDLLGVGGLGFNVGRGDYPPPRPWEVVLLPPSLLQPHAGRYALKFGEPMEEVCYLDAINLVAYDLPPGWQMTIDERFGESPPLPTGAAIFYREQLPPTRAIDTRGSVVTDLVRHADGRAVEPGAHDRRFVGLTAPHTLTLEFSKPIEACQGDPVLVLAGWVEYPYSQTTFAAWQAGESFQSATLEACGADGQWQMVHQRFGYPAGMPREMALPIARHRLPRGTTKLRLSTNMEVYWDAAQIALAEPCAEARRRVLSRESARLESTGFAHRTTLAQRRPVYDYGRRAAKWDTRHPQGLYTAFGRVDPLLDAVDDAVVVFGPGEEVHVEFAVGESPLPENWTRRHVVESHGWCKDMDMFTRDGQTVGPLPRRDSGVPESERSRALHRQFNTRRN